MTGVVLVTGGTGFVGRQIVQALHELGVSVRAVVREGSHDKFKAENVLEGLIVSSNLFAEESSWWAEVCRGVDTVIHVAWYVDPADYLRSVKNLDCLRGTLEAAKGAAQARVRRFVGIGTCFEYDLGTRTLSVETPLQPATLYASTKAAAFMILSQWLPQENVEFAWCRLFYLYGEGEDGRRLVPYLRMRLAAGQPAELTSGTQVRDYLDVREAGRMIVETALSDIEGPVNICSGVPVTVRQLAEKVADECGRRDLLRFDARADNLVDPPYVLGLRREP